MTDIPFEGMEIEKVSLDDLYRKFKGRCYVCKSPVPRDDASREHIIPRSLGGTDDEDNLTISHKRCNNKRGNGYNSIYSKHHDLTHKEHVIIDSYGLLVQIVPDAYGGIYLVIGKKDSVDK